MTVKTHTQQEALVLRWFEEVWNQGRAEAIDEMMAPDALIHDSGRTVQGVEAFRAFFRKMSAAFSDIRVAVADDMVSSEDRVCARFTVTVKHTGDGLGISATHKEVSATGICMLEIREGRFTQAWQNWDMLGLLEQLQGKRLAPLYVRE